MAAVDFFSGLQRLLETEQLKAENQQLKQEVRKLEALWRRERESRQNAERQLKVALVGLTGAMPPHCWPTAVQALSSFRPIWRKLSGAVANHPALTFATCCKIPANLPE